jgi:hypothetical protein
MIQPRQRKDLDRERSRAIGGPENEQLNRDAQIVRQRPDYWEVGGKTVTWPTYTGVTLGHHENNGHVVTLVQGCLLAVSFLQCGDDQ